MHYLAAHITLSERWHFTAVNSVSITETMDSLTDTATLVLPRKIQWRDKNLIVERPLKRGDSVRIALGYDGQVQEVFRGYIRAQSYEDALTLTCENDMFRLKSAAITPRVVTGNLGQLLRALLPQWVNLYPAPDHNSHIGAYRFTESSVAKELANIKKTYGLHLFFTEGKLFAGWLRPHKQQVAARFLWQKHILSSELHYQDAEDVAVQIKAIAFNEKGKRIQVIYGDKGGEERAFFMANASKQVLMNKAKDFYQKLKLPRYQGSFTSFGAPLIRKGDSIYIAGKDGNSGTYLVKEVLRSFGREGYRQQITLDYKID